jgi:hypothetical protein
MKTIVETATGLSKYLLDDSVAITKASDHIAIGDPVESVIWDLNSDTATVYENLANTRADWVGNKYTFDGTTWTQNPDWVEPESE